MTGAGLRAGMSVSAIDPALFRSTMGHFPTGVSVMSTRDGEGRPYGITVSSFASLSLDPPLVQWSLGCNAFSYPLFSKARHFSVSILADDQEEVSRRFCASEDRFAGVMHEEGLFGLPLLDGALAWIECELVNEFPGGDHAIFIGEVLRLRHWQKEPLLHWQGKYHRLSAQGSHNFADCGLRAGSSQ